ncbi:MAG TPA: FG-GAP-like repeat-containing protein, partial [Thermoanaerobaculia bacterium]|nr:FG-GAP-like repeat-containing protein [Thermoanaerobaculia bacterium]
MRRAIRAGFAPALVSLLFAAAATADCLTVPWTASYHNAGNLVLRDVVAADFDGDGDRDIAATTSTSAVFFRNNGPNGLAAPSLLHTGGALTGIAAVDMTGDSRIDVVLADSTARELIVVPGNGNATFRNALKLDVLDVPREFAVADFTADGDPDVVTITTAPPSVTVYANGGNGELIPLSQATIPANPVSIRAGDLDADNKPDVMIGHSNATSMTVLFGFGDGGFGNPVAVAGRRHAADTAAADLDGDGDRELVAANVTDNNVSVNMNDGGRAFRSAVTYARTGNPTSLAIADFSGDGRVDVAVATNSGPASFTTNANGTLRPASSGACTDCDLTSLAVADMNGDGRLDLVSGATRKLVVMTNHCGALTLTLAAQSTTIAAGSPALLTATVTLPSPASIAPTGTLQIRKGTQTLATAPMTATGVDVAVPGLAPGEHTLTAHYAGDDEYDPKTSASVTVKVVTAAATVSLTQSSAQTNLGEEHRVVARVTTEGTDVTGGTVNLRVNNVHVSSHPAPGFDVATKLGAGTHTIVARYSGDEAHGSADSAPLTHT